MRIKNIRTKLVMCAGVILIMVNPVYSEVKSAPVSIADATNITCGVLYVTETQETGKEDVYLASADGKTRLNLTRGRFNRPWNPVGSPDGRNVVFSGNNYSGMDGRSNIRL